MYKKNRIGETYKNKLGYTMIVTDYKSANDIEVTFEDGSKVKTRYSLLKNGWVRNPNMVSVRKNGIKGINKISKDGIGIKEYRAWQGMLTRCFDEKYKNKKNTYMNVGCCKEWLIFENFYEWVINQENYQVLKMNKINWNLDKDILIKGNKIYSPENCCLVPVNVNCLFVKSNAIRGDYPIGVTFDKRWNVFISRCCDPYGKRIKHSGFKTPVEAFNQYKLDKENIIKKVAITEYQKGFISKKCFDAMMNYQVEITD